MAVADTDRSGAGTSVGVVLGLLCIGGGGFAMWRRKQQQHQNKPARQRVNRGAAKQEFERNETQRNTIQMEDNPLRLSRAGTPAPAEYVNVRLPSQQLDRQDLQANVGVDSGDAIAQQSVAAEYTVPSDAGLAARCRVPRR